jgi:hypothetical protein
MTDILQTHGSIFVAILPTGSRSFPSLLEGTSGALSGTFGLNRWIGLLCWPTG